MVYNPVNDPFSDKYNSYGSQTGSALAEKLLKENPQAIGSAGNVGPGGLPKSGGSGEDDAKDKFGRSLGKGYGNMMSTLNDVIGFNDRDEDKLRSNISSMSGEMRSSLDANYQGQRKNLDTSRQNVMSDQRDSFVSLRDRLGSEMRTANDYLGTRGAGDSSANQAYARGLMGEASKNRRNILEQARSQYTEIKTKEQQAEQYHALESENINKWAEEKISAVKDAFKQQREKLSKLKSNADDYESEDLDNMDSYNLQRAYDQIQQVENQRQQWIGALDSWKQDVRGRVNALKSELIEMTQFDEKDIEMPELDVDLETEGMENTEDLGTYQQKKPNSLQDFLGNEIV